jgi:hypothetical protein
MIRLLLLLLALTCAAFAQNSSTPHTVIMFGDSITAGGSWMKQLRKSLAGR